MTAKSTKSKTNRKKTGTTSKKSTSNKKTTKKNTKKTTRSTRTAKSGNSFLMDEILIWITLAVSIILLISNFGVAGFLGDAVSGVLWEIFGAVAYIIPFVLFGLVSFPFQPDTLPVLPVFLLLPVFAVPVQPLSPTIGSPVSVI